MKITVPSAKYDLSNLDRDSLRVIGQGRNNMLILMRFPTAGVHSESTMDTKTRGDHMAGGGVVTIRSVDTHSDENHNQHTFAFHEIHDLNVSRKTHGARSKNPDKRQDKPSIRLHIPTEFMVKDPENLAIKSQDTRSSEAVLPMRIDLNIRASPNCMCSKSRRRSSVSTDDSDSSKSPRSPKPLPIPNAPFRKDSLSPQPMLLTNPQQYENIPVPGIIPLSRATCSPTLQLTTAGNSDLISFYSRLSCLSATSDKHVIIASEERLKATGFYYDNISALEAKNMLHSVQVGTFLVRVSSQPSHFFALSVKTNRGTTSIRIAYDNGCFRLDADPESIGKMPAFKCVVALIEYYVVQSASDARNKCVFLESTGRRDTPVILTRPLKTEPQGLRHLCRRALHYNLTHAQLEQLLQKSSASIQVRQYLQKYPYAL